MSESLPPSMPERAGDPVPPSEPLRLPDEPRLIETPESIPEPEPTPVEVMPVVASPSLPPVEPPSMLRPELEQLAAAVDAAPDRRSERPRPKKHRPERTSRKRPGPLGRLISLIVSVGLAWALTVAITAWLLGLFLARG